MINIYASSTIRLVQRLSMFLTLGCCAYVILFSLSKGHNDPVSAASNGAAMKNMGLPLPVSALDLKAYDASVSGQARDIFSLSDSVDSSGNVENTPKGQLPAHLKIVGILISNPSQIIIEDTFAKKTYFIDEDDPQDGIKIVQVDKDRMTINYKGQDIYVPIKKN